MRTLPAPIPKAPALLLLGIICAQGCSTFGQNRENAQEEQPVAEEEDGALPLSFDVEIVSEDRNIARLLRQHLDIQRFRGFPDLQPNELRRLLEEAEANARDLLAAQGYFEPALSLSVDDSTAQVDGRRRIIIRVDRGPRTRVSGYEIAFTEPMNGDANAARQRQAIREEWSLKQGGAFTQEAWDSAKGGGLRTLQRERYPMARIASSQATVTVDMQTADLAVTYEPGPLYRFGSLQIGDLQRYDAEGIRNIARIPVGDDYSESALLDAQQRLVSSGYFDSAFLMLDPDEENPEAATIVAQLREAKYQKAIFGLGYSTDSGLRTSVDHTHNEMWPLGWRALNQIELGTETQSLSTHWTDMPGSSGWAWYVGGTLERTDYGDYKANTISLTGGRMKSTARMDHRFYVQYDASRTEGSGSPGSSSSILGNYGWTARYFDDRLNPTRGFGLGGEAGLGFTLTPEQKPFLRLTMRGQQFLPMGRRNEFGRQGRFALRTELGTILAEDDVDIPVTLLFLTGGDMTVRGYSYQSIGTILEDGSVYGARHLASASVEWQQPVTLFGDPRSFELALFVDTGTASDNLRNAELSTGVGTGVRWNSPVGPLQTYVAYGLDGGGWRLHLRMGFQF